MYGMKGRSMVMIMAATSHPNNLNLNLNPTLLVVIKSLQPDDMLRSRPLLSTCCAMHPVGHKTPRPSIHTYMALPMAPNAQSQPNCAVEPPRRGFEFQRMAGCAKVLASGPHRARTRAAPHVHRQWRSSENQLGSL